MQVTVDNDANLGALAEMTYGAARGARDLVYVKAASGVGAGIVLGGRLHHGVGGMAGELGHVHVEDDGRVCRCGNRGCLETVAAAARAARAPARVPRRGPHASAACSSSPRAATSAPARPRRTPGWPSGAPWPSPCNLLNPELVVVGGDLALAGEPLLEGVRESLGRYALPSAAEAARVTAGVLGDRAEVLGALPWSSPTPRTFAPRHWERCPPQHHHHHHSTRSRRRNVTMRHIPMRMAVSVALASVALVVAACGSDNNDSSSSSSSGSSSSGPSKKIALLLPESKTTRYEAQDRPLFEAKVKALCPNCKLIYSNADQDASKQQQQAEAAITQGANVIVLDPVDAASAAAIVNRAKQSNIPVVSYDRLISTPTSTTTSRSTTRRSASSRAQRCSRGSAARTASRSS